MMLFHHLHSHTSLIHVQVVVVHHKELNELLFIIADDFIFTSIKSHILPVLNFTILVLCTCNCIGITMVFSDSKEIKKT